MSTKVVNKYKEEFDVYIGRGSIYGNEWTHSINTKATFIVASRDEAIQCYKDWLTGKRFVNFKQELRSAILESLPNLKGKKLGCYCAPQKCHGDILVDLINEAAVEYL